jgi:hypothetical protein
LVRNFTLLSIFEPFGITSKDIETVVALGPLPNTETRLSSTLQANR